MTVAARAMLPRIAIHHSVFAFSSVGSGAPNIASQAAARQS